MTFAKFLKDLTACSLAFWLAACSTTPQTDFNRTEAVKARINLALAYLEQKDYPKAKENIDKALAHDEADYLPHSVLAYYYQLIGEAENAESAYQKALDLSKKQNDEGQVRPDVLNNYGTFLCKQRKFDAAYTQFEEALKSKQPYYNQADSLENIVLCANLAGDTAKQNEVLTRLEKLAPERADQLKIVIKQQN